jgi:hypothetical protein
MAAQVETASRNIRAIRLGFISFILEEGIVPDPSCH